MWRTWLGVAAMLAVVILAIGARDESTTFQACISNQRADYASQQQVKSPTDVSVPIIQRWPIALKCTGNFLDTNNAAIGAVATLVIAIFTIVLAVVTGTQARLTKETLIANRRAFVFAAGLSPLWEVNKDSGEYCWRVRPNWRNTGDTPTRNLTIYSDGELRNTPLPDQYDFSRIAIQPGTGLIGPHTESFGGPCPHLPGAPLSPQDIVDMQARRKFFYVWGWAKYNDVFPGTESHITRFCWLVAVVGDPKLYRPDISPGQPGHLVFHNVHMSQGNYADEERS